MTTPLGEQLRQARQARSLSLEKVSQETYIRLHYLQALEEGNLDALPSLAQARGFLRAYAGYLGLDLDLDQALGDLGQEPGPASALAAAPEPPAHDGDRTAEAIFVQLGQQLRQQRDLLGFSLQDVEEHTHLRVHYLEALEAGRLADLPSPVQGRGMLSNYATFLGMDPEPLLLRFADGLQAQLAARRGEARRPVDRRAGLSSISWVRRLLSGDLLLGGALIISLTAFVIWGAIRISATRAAAVLTPTAPPLAEVLLLTPSPTPNPPTPDTSPQPDQGVQPAVTAESAELIIPELDQGALQVYVVVRQRTWMRVLVDGEVAFDGRVLAGSAYPFSGDEQVEVLTGNGAGLQIYFNQQDLGTLGFFGEVVDRIYTSEGVLTPTPTPTATASPTPRTTPTATASPSPGATTTP